MTTTIDKYLLDRVARERRFDDRTMEIARRLFLKEEKPRKLALEYAVIHQRIYAIARRIPPGQTRTYGDIAAELGDKGLSRAVGQAMGHNPFAPVVPCHRVLAAGNKPGGFSAGGGALTKLRMLDIEGARPNGMASLF